MLATVIGAQQAAGLKALRNTFKMIEDDLQQAEPKLSVDSRTTQPPSPSAHNHTKPLADPFPSEWLEIPQAFDRRKRAAQAA
jgi:hypothetical protein